VLGQLTGEFSPTARVLVLELHAGGTHRVSGSDALCPFLSECHRDSFGLRAVGLTDFGLSSVSTACQHKGLRPIRVSEPKVKCTERAHGQPNNVSPLDAQVVEDRNRVVDGVIL